MSRSRSSSTWLLRLSSRCREYAASLYILSYTRWSPLPRDLEVEAGLRTASKPLTVVKLLSDLLFLIVESTVRSNCLFLVEFDHVSLTF